MKNLHNIKFSLIIYMTISLSLNSCSPRADVPNHYQGAPRKIAPSYYLSIISNNIDIFGIDVPIFESTTQADSVLSLICESSYSYATDLAHTFRISNNDFDNYLTYLEVLDWAFGENNYQQMIDCFDGVDEQEKTAEIKLLNELEGNEHLLSTSFILDTLGNDNYVISPASPLDRSLLRNVKNLFICGDSVYRWENGKEFVFHIEEYVHYYNIINEQILSYSYGNYPNNLNPPTPYSTQYRRFERHQYKTIGNNSYKLLAVFKTDYHVVLRPISGDHHIDVYNRVWVKNYKKGTWIYWPTKFHTEGRVSFYLVWEDNSRLTGSYPEDFKTIEVNGKYAIKDFRMNIPRVYNDLPLPIDEYWINYIEFDINNGRNHIRENFEYQWN